jgi:3-hydroxyacyl-[acyl-carrier-protein] dehydratase
MTKNIEMSIHDILKYLPHRYPFLLVDRVLSCEVGQSILAIKNVSFNEPFFQGHFPNAPVMPGVLILEALAQASGLLALSNPDWRPDDESLYLLLVSIRLVLSDKSGQGIS